MTIPVSPRPAPRRAHRRAALLRRWIDSLHGRARQDRRISALRRDRHLSRDLGLPPTTDAPTSWPFSQKPF